MTLDDYLATQNHEAVVEFCKEKQIGLVVVGPEQPLAEGIADSLSKRNIACFGPVAAAAKLEVRPKLSCIHFSCGS